MPRTPWDGEVWRPSGAAAKATHNGGPYAVRFRIEPRALAAPVWDQLSRTLRTMGEVLLDGGASFRRVGDDVFEVISGGEDVLDSLSWSLNVTALEAARAAQAREGVPEAAPEAKGTSEAEPVRIRIIGDQDQ